MKTKLLITIFFNLIICNLLISQNITNTLGTNGVFKIKHGTIDYLSLNQSNGQLSISRNLVLSNTSSSTSGVIYKGPDWFLHDYSGNGTDGYNTFLGINSGNFTLGGLLSMGSYNTAVGAYSLFSLTTGSCNSAFGFESLVFNTSGQQNSAFGYLSLYNNSAGNSNSAFGVASLYFNTTGIQNSAFGLASLKSNTTGNNNSALGTNSQYSNTIGFDNTSIGNNSMYSNTTGTQNTAVGYGALRNNVSGWQNTGIGHHSLINNTGNYNTAIGYNSGSTVTTGENLTLLGIDANPSSPTASNQITLGNQFISSLRCNVTSITSLSDSRDKKNISELSLGLDFITKLKPRQFNWDKREWYDENISDGSKTKEAPTAGFIAQELDEVQTTTGAEWLNLVLKDNPEKWEATYGNLLPVMVKAIQELKAENDKIRVESEKLKVVSEELRTENKLIKQRLSSYEELQNTLVNRLEKLESNNIKEVIFTQE
jgi:trimeric autotransporter adhesin